MEPVKEFKTKVSGTTDKKELKGTVKEYTYGTISIRSPKLNSLIGKEVTVKVFVDSHQSEQ